MVEQESFPRKSPDGRSTVSIPLKKIITIIISVTMCHQANASRYFTFAWFLSDKPSIGEIQ